MSKPRCGKECFGRKNAGPIHRNRDCFGVVRIFFPSNLFHNSEAVPDSELVAVVLPKLLMNGVTKGLSASSDRSANLHPKVSRPYLLANTPLGSLQAFPNDGKCSVGQ